MARLKGGKRRERKKTSEKDNGSAVAWGAAVLCKAMLPSRLP